MIVAQQKPIEDIAQMINDCKKVLFVGCAGCVTVCLAGGDKETQVLASAMRIKRNLENNPLEAITFTCTRQCDPEYIEPLDNLVKDVDAIVSLACGVGVQYLAERFKDKWVVPALDTKFIGGSTVHGSWEEKCGLCGDCILHRTGGICPIIRCSKSILNGPCGGSQYGKCEVSKDVDCAWQLIYDRMKALGKLDKLMEFQPPKDWSKSRDGGPRKAIREDVMID
ncbi:methylenetetrahydrofolate reductase C-terminal domain-containing protein [Desulfoscipio gibsoniae]|uniref:Methylene-tetrahydrofolate reductase C terminal n=1 Tax=Desulfoscipio gibsoniae DSM 7213 TaxID=767817 RepID=R4KLP9_9FIRM|nr:methylenetetrahydrofolate reductase C-terminal domain-containing protein [Desulfoscipio gibsoniae]AGL01475.1 Methylene-tetrahydrofolate reductase C terminal [Desulfoscipio gibsoniae DSM 7213]